MRSIGDTDGDVAAWAGHVPATTVADVMVRQPKVLAADATVGAVRAALDDDHVHMALLADGDVLRGTVIREDVPTEAPDDSPALRLSRLAGRTVAPDAPAEVVRRRLLQQGARRLAVVDGDGMLLGLLCLKRRLNGFCSDADVAARACAAAS